MLPDRTDKTVAAMASASMSVRLGDGSAALFWTDKWTSARTLSTTLAPDLFAVITRAGRRQTVRDALLGNRWARDIAGATTVQVLCQFLKVWELTREVVLDPLQSDRFVWKWSADGRYSASSTYRAFFLGSTSLLGARELWRTRAPPRVKFFGWLALHRRLWTAERRMRHGLQVASQANNDCSLCGQAAETVEHMLLGCVLVRQLSGTPCCSRSVSPRSRRIASRIYLNGGWPNGAALSGMQDQCSTLCSCSWHGMCGSIATA